MAETTATTSPQRDGAERAAILLMTLGEKEAADVLKHMGAREVQRIGSAMTQVGNISRNDVLEVIAEFNALAEGQSSIGVGSDEFVRKTLVSALGEERASNVIDRILTNRSSKGLDSLKWMDGRAIAEMVKFEHPQIIAIILSYLEPQHSAEVIANLPESVRTEAMVRIALLDGVQPSALRELDLVIEKQFSAAAGTQTSALGGPKCAADIINISSPASKAP
jgi:flagellar motor switch protein FliG